MVEVQCIIVYGEVIGGGGGGQLLDLFVDCSQVVFGGCYCGSEYCFFVWQCFYVYVEVVYGIVLYYFNQVLGDCIVGGYQLVVVGYYVVVFVWEGCSIYVIVEFIGIVVVCYFGLCSYY